MATQEVESNFNMGVSHLIRIDNILDTIAEKSFSCSPSNGEYSDIFSWLDLVNLLNREVNFLFNEEEDKESVSLNNKATELVAKWTEDKTKIENYIQAYNSVAKYEKWTKQQLVKRKMLMSFNKDQTRSIVDL